MARLPRVGDDKGTWGDILNDFLSQSHADDGTLKASTVGAPQLRPGSVTNAAVGDGTLAQAKISGLSDALAAKADATNVVTLTGPQTVTGDKDFTGQLSQDGNAVVTTVDGRLSDQRVPINGSVTSSKLAAGAITTAAIADGQVSKAKLQGAGAANGIATLDGTGTLPEAQVPARLSDGQLSAKYVGLVQAAKNPDLLIVGSITRDANQAVTSAQVVWPDGTPGTFTADAVSTAFPGAVDGYHITYGSPTSKTFTQPTITRNTAGAAITVPQIGVS